MVLPGVPRKKFPVTPPGIDPGTSRLAAQCLNHYATPDPKEHSEGTKIRTDLCDNHFLLVTEINLGKLHDV